MTPSSMRQLANNWADAGNLAMRDLWLMCAEVCERLEQLATPERRGEGE